MFGGRCLCQPLKADTPPPAYGKQMRRSCADLLGWGQATQPEEVSGTDDPAARSAQSVAIMIASAPRSQSAQIPRRSQRMGNRGAQDNRTLIVTLCRGAAGASGTLGPAHTTLGTVESRGGPRRAGLTPAGRTGVVDVVSRFSIRATRACFRYLTAPPPPACFRYHSAPPPPACFRSLSAPLRFPEESQSSPNMLGSFPRSSDPP
jgi:hypothetical protein